MSALLAAWDFRNCRVELDHAAQWIGTRFNDGTVCEGRPHTDAHYRDVAALTGNGADVWRYCLEHELFHTIAAEALRLPFSPTSWTVAHDPAAASLSYRPIVDGRPLSMGRDERLALALHCYVRAQPLPEYLIESLEVFTRTGLSLSELVSSSWRILTEVERNLPLFVGVADWGCEHCRQAG